MKFTATPVQGAVVIDLEPRQDERGFFARTWCAQEFRERGLTPVISQCSVSFNRRRGTLRGMHFQTAPDEEAKVVRCTAGAIFDVVLDLRRDSPSFRRWFGLDLTAANRRMLYVPEGCAHGFQTLAEDTEVFYQISRPHNPAAEAGVRWNDPAFGIAWPLPPSAVSPKDQGYPDFRP